MKKIGTIVMFALISFTMQAQDFWLSQPYNNPLTVAPSYAGLNNGGRVALSYRNQWPAANKGKMYCSYVAAFDYFAQRFNSGFGVLLSGDSQAGGLLRTVDVDVQYNYRVQINRNLFFRPGVQVGLTHKSLNTNNLIFSENIANDGSYFGSGSPVNFERDNYTKFDAAVSALLYNSSFWVGVTIDHLIPNKVSFLEGKYMLPMRGSIQAGYNWVYKEGGWRNPNDESLTFGLLAQHQGNFNQMDLGVTWTKHPVQIGVWYRDFFIPTKTKLRRDALIFVLGIHTEKFKIAYSYDLSISGHFDASAGSHELTMSFFFAQQEKSPISFFCR